MNFTTCAGAPLDRRRHPRHRAPRRPRRFLTNAPNPFNPATTIAYTLPEPLHVTIRLFTAQGQLARPLVDDDRTQGPHAFAFSAADLASGVYYHQLTAGRFTETRKLTLLR